MKKSLLLICLIAVVLMSFKLRKMSETPNAIVEKVNGVDVYVYSRPIREYDVIKSSISNGLVFDGGDGVIMRSAKKAFDEKGDGVIIHLKGSRYEVIKYK